MLIGIGSGKGEMMITEKSKQGNFKWTNEMVKRWNGQKRVVKYENRMHAHNHTHAEYTHAQTRIHDEFTEISIEASRKTNDKAIETKKKMK